MGRRNQWGIKPVEVKRWVYEVAAEYAQLTLRTLHYRLVSLYDFPNVHGAYKWLSRWAKRWRLEDPELNQKFVDYTRRPIVPKPPSLSKIEVWVEKITIYAILKDIIEKFKTPVQIQRGYGSLSMYTKAIQRAQKRGVEAIVYLGDLDPSGLDIARITRKMMSPTKVRRIALTWGQVRRYRLPPRPANPRDRRTPRYVKRHGDQAYEVEALDPRVLRKIAEQGLRKMIPPEDLQRLEVEEKAEKITVRILKPVRERIEKMVRELLKRGLSPEEIAKRVGQRMGWKSGK